MVSVLKKQHRVAVTAVGVILLVSLTLFTVGLVFILNKKCENIANTPSSELDPCAHSDEAVKSGLIDVLANAQRTYSEVSPKAFISVSDADHLSPSRTYLNPSTIKEATDKARELFKQLKSLVIDRTKLSSRELRGLAQAEHFLSNNFGQAEEDYYIGSWMLGPNIMCAMDYMCWLFQQHVQVSTSIRYRPKTVQNVLQVRQALAYYNDTIYQYMENIRYGVSRGMVRSTEACMAGFEAMKTKYSKVAEFNAPGVLQETFVQHLLWPGYYINLENKAKVEWLKTYGKTVNESIREYLVEFIGKSLEKLLRFLQYENILHCVPSNISSGLANLPLSHVYFNGTKTTATTAPFLPTGEKLDGKKTYEKLLAFYTTTHLTADEVYDLGRKHVNLLYAQILQLAENVTGLFNESQAAEKFKERLTDRSQYYNEESFPQNESFAVARKWCLNVVNATKFCPKRWEALQAWFDEQSKLFAQLDPKTGNLFHFSGSKRTTPNCPIQLLPSFRTLAAPSYQQSSSNCGRPAKMRLPFFNDDYGPRFQGILINSHEGRPGHHTQMQGYLENFKSGCPPDVVNWLRHTARYYSFLEGWGLYAESPLIVEYTDAVKDKPLSRYGMLKGQIWRALRLVVDTGLHYKEMKRDKAVALLNEYMWDTSDVISKEVDRYQSVPGQATSYMVGQLTFIDLLQHARKELGKNFSIRDFHYELLRHGSVPLHYIKYQVERYVACKKNGTDCEHSRPKTSPASDESSSTLEYEMNLHEMMNFETYF